MSRNAYSAKERSGMKREHVIGDILLLTAALGVVAAVLIGVLWLAGYLH